jgi:transcriptional regulator with XRE-family HTH domain
MAEHDEDDNGGGAQKPLLLRSGGRGRRTQGRSLIDREIGERLRVWRVKANMSQARLGECVGVSFQQIQKYEKGQNSVHPAMLFALAATLHVDVTDLLGVGVRNMEAELTASIIQAEERTRRLVVLNRAITAIDDPARQAAIIHTLIAFVRASAKSED